MMYQNQFSFQYLTHFAMWTGVNDLLYVLSHNNLSVFLDFSKNPLGPLRRSLKSLNYSSISSCLLLTSVSAFAPHCEVDMALLGSLLHQLDHQLVRLSHHRRSIHAYQLITGSQASIFICSPVLDYVANVDLKRSRRMRLPCIRNHASTKTAQLYVTPHLCKINAWKAIKRYSKKKKYDIKVHDI